MIGAPARIAARVSGWLGVTARDLDQPRLARLEIGQEAVLEVVAPTGGDLALLVLVRPQREQVGLRSRPTLPLRVGPFAPGGEVALEVGDQVGRGVAEPTAGGAEHRGSRVGTGGEVGCRG